MEIWIKNEVARQIGPAKFVPFGLNKDDFDYNGSHGLKLSRLTRKQLDDLVRLLVEYKKIRSVGVMLRDVRTWIDAKGSAAEAKARTVKLFSSLLINYMLKVPGQRVYKYFTNDKEVPLCYYVNSVTFVEAQRTSYGGYIPAHVNVVLIHSTFGEQKASTVTFWEDDCRGLTVREALLQMGYMPETEELRDNYLSEVKRYHAIVPEIGMQFLASGSGTDDLDGNPSRDNSWYWRKTHVIPLAKNGQPTRVVVDVFCEEDKEEDRKEKDLVRSWFWINEAKGHRSRDDDDDESEDGDLEAPQIEIPIHPFVAVFDLVRHLRLKVHVSYLEKYVYDDTMAEKLVLEPELKELVLMLLRAGKVTYRDVVKGKSGGAIVLLAGPPGVGKTLTAELLAESEGRPLYSVQCSQLGVSPEDLEDELLKVFTRAKRWNALLLLDEADVYVKSRGNDLDQNAIVGVFLRVLEYQDTTLCMTTNRPDDVDDAVASRCVARCNYKVPSPEMQAQIWRVLAEATDANLSEATIKKVVKASPGLSGRDVKNLLKLAMLTTTPGKPITSQKIEFVKQFRPNETSTTMKQVRV